jgi:hypothetical protein
MEIRDRIKEFRRVKAFELRPNPKNWRTHPQAQQDALRGVLAEIGYADALLARELPDGGLMLVDGHLRAETTPDMEVPVLVLDVTESEADKILATLDPLASLAVSDTEKLEALLADVDTQSAAVQEMLDGLSGESKPKTEIIQLSTEEPPKMAWAIIGIPLDRWEEVASELYDISQRPEIIFETTVSDSDGKD